MPASCPGGRAYTSASAAARVISASVMIDNTANLATIGEPAFRVCCKVSSLTESTSRCHYGVGAGLVVNGQPVAGQRRTWLKIGHLSIDDKGAICRCGNRGCPDTVVGSPPSCRRAAPFPRRSDPRDVIGVRCPVIGCRRVLADAGEALGWRPLSWAWSICSNPEVIVIGGQMARSAGPAARSGSAGDQAVRSAAQCGPGSPDATGWVHWPMRRDVVGALALANEVRECTGRPALAVRAGEGPESLVKLDEFKP